MKRLIKSLTILLAIGLINSTYARAGSFSPAGEKSYETELKALNAFLEDFEDGFYGFMEADDQFITIRFQEGKYSKFRLQDMAAPVLDTKWGQVNWDCKQGYCVETDWNEEGKETGILFSQAGAVDLEYLMELLQNFISAYSSK